MIPIERLLNPRSILLFDIKDPSLLRFEKSKRSLVPPPLIFKGNQYMDIQRSGKKAGGEVFSPDIAFINAEDPKVSEYINNCIGIKIPFVFLIGNPKDHYLISNEIKKLNENSTGGNESILIGPYSSGYLNSYTGFVSGPYFPPDYFGDENGKLAVIIENLKLNREKLDLLLKKIHSSSIIIDLGYQPSSSMLDTDFIESFSSIQKIKTVLLVGDSYSEFVSRIAPARNFGNKKPLILLKEPLERYGFEFLDDSHDIQHEYQKKKMTYVKGLFPIIKAGSIEDAEEISETLNLFDTVNNSRVYIITDKPGAGTVISDYITSDRISPRLPLASISKKACDTLVRELKSNIYRANPVSLNAGCTFKQCRRLIEAALEDVFIDIIIIILRENSVNLKDALISVAKEEDVRKPLFIILPNEKMRENEFSFLPKHNIMAFNSIKKAAIAVKNEVIYSQPDKIIIRTKTTGGLKYEFI